MCPHSTAHMTTHRRPSAGDIWASPWRLCRCLCRCRGSASRPPSPPRRRAPDLLPALETPRERPPPDCPPLRSPDASRDSRPDSSPRRRPRGRPPRSRLGPPRHPEPREQERGGFRGWTGWRGCGCPGSRARSWGWSAGKGRACPADGSWCTGPRMVPGRTPRTSPPGQQHPGSAVGGKTMKKSKQMLHAVMGVMCIIREAKSNQPIKQNIHKLFPRRSKTKLTPNFQSYFEINYLETELFSPTTVCMESPASASWFSTRLSLFVPAACPITQWLIRLELVGLGPHHESSAPPSFILCQYWDSATKRNGNFNCQRTLMMPFSISATLHQACPPPLSLSKGRARLHLEPQ